MIWQTAHRCFDFGMHAAVMGIINVTPDSFSDAGTYHVTTRAIEHGMNMLSLGADIIDVGGESTRPGAMPVPAEEELRRVLPVVEGLRALAPDSVISVDTSKATVAAAALACGASIINDVTALTGDPEMARVLAQSNAAVVLMHMQGNPRDMQRNPTYGNVTAEIRHFFEQRLDFALSAGIAPERIALDPGIGFGKTVEHNLTLLRELNSLSVANLPLVLGVSRKQFLAKVTGIESMPERLWPTVALTALLRERGACVLRVHDVGPNVAALRMTEAILRPDWWKG